MRLLGLRPKTNREGLRSAEAPLFHVTARVSLPTFLQAFLYYRITARLTEDSSQLKEHRGLRFRGAISTQLNFQLIVRSRNRI
jgi:hypothetical protein